MEAKHTPGPWIVRSELSQLTIWGGCASIIANIRFDENRRALADARIIAAAPALLAALQAFVDYHEGDYPYEDGEETDDGRSPEMTQALAAIAKAKG